MIFSKNMHLLFVKTYQVVVFSNALKSILLKGRELAIAVLDRSVNCLFIAA